jgi:hypothetical protein
LLLPFVIYPQITITQSDFTSIYSIGGTSTSFADTSKETVNIGQPGGGNNWDFSGYAADYILEIAFVSPSATPYADSFATSNIANYIQQFLDLGEGTTTATESWSYFNSNDGSNAGTISEIVFTDSSGTYNSKSVTHHYPPFIEYDFPLTFDKMWTAKDSSETINMSDGVAGPVSITTTVYNMHIDAWGTMTMPSGRVVDALRSREQETSTSYFFGVPIGTSTSVTYFFMTKSGESFSVLADDEDPPTSGSITGLIAWANDEVTNVEKLESVPTEFSLKQNYPNPFNPTTNIEYSILRESNVKLTIFDLLGNEVAELINESQTPGNYTLKFDGSDLASGTYLVKLNAGEFNEVRKIMLLK